MKPNSQRLVLAALEADNYRSFIRLTMACRYAHRVMPLAELAEKAGFSSKGYISDLLSGKKKLTKQSLSRISSALSLPARLARYFELLAAREEPALRLLGQEMAEIEIQLAKLRRAFRDRAEEKSEVVRRGSGIHHHRIYRIYAALGSLEKGASFAQILKRTSIPESVARESLDLLVALKLARLEKDRYYGEPGNIEALGLSDESQFREVLGTALAAFTRKIQAPGTGARDCYFYASFALSEGRELELKQKLHELICGFVDEHQDEDGAMVKTIVLGLF